MRMLVVLALGAGLFGCKKTPTETPVEPAAPAKKEITAQMPASVEAKGFAERLVDLNVENWSFPDGVLKYENLDFQPDGAWFAAGVVEAGGETMECKEQGTWSIEAAASPEAAFLNWTTDKTNCPGREGGTSQRVQMTIDEQGTYRIAFR